MAMAMAMTLTCWQKVDTGLIKQMVYADIVEIKAVQALLSRGVQDAIHFQ